MEIKNCSHITLHNFKDDISSYGNLNLDTKCIDCKKTIRQILKEQK
jgi:hypothetical protein